MDAKEKAVKERLPSKLDVKFGDNLRL